MEEVRITNLIANGDFETDINGWVNVVGEISRTTFSNSEDDALKLTSTADNQNICFELSTGISLIASHKYYTSQRVAQLVQDNCTIQQFWPSTATVPISIGTLATQNNWYWHQRILDVSGATSGVYPLRFTVPGAANNKWAYFDKIVLVDLTVAFGAGNEPDLAWCKANVPKYFDGSMALPFWKAEVPVFEEASVTPIETTVGSTVQITAKLKIASKLFAAESLYSGEIYSGEV